MRSPVSIFRFPPCPAQGRGAEPGLLFWVPWALLHRSLSLIPLEIPDCPGCGQVGVWKLWRRGSSLGSSLGSWHPAAPRAWGNPAAPSQSPPRGSSRGLFSGPFQLVLGWAPFQWCFSEGPRELTLQGTQEVTHFCPGTEERGCPHTRGEVSSAPRVWIWGFRLRPRDSGGVKGGDLPSSTSHALWS